MCARYGFSLASMFEEVFCRLLRLESSDWGLRSAIVMAAGGMNDSLLLNKNCLQLEGARIMFVPITFLPLVRCAARLDKR